MMKSMILTAAAALMLAAGALAGDLWQWAPGHYSYSGENGYHSDGFQWAPGHTTWTDSNGRTTDVWEWAPGHYNISH